MQTTHRTFRVGFLRDGLLRHVPMSWHDEWVSVLVAQLLLATLLLRLLWLSQPQGSLVFDETYYVNAVRVILGLPLPEGAPYADAPVGLDPNKEHFPLAKLIVAGSMRLLGDNAVGWRLPSVLFGTAAVAILYLLVRRLTQRPWLALFAAFIFSFDNLVFVHSRIATLDIFMVAFMLLGVYLYVAERPALAGAAFALSALCKINGVFGLVAVVGMVMLQYVARQDLRQRPWLPLANLLILVGSFLVTLLLVLWPLDRQWSSYDNPIDHVAHVWNYGLTLRRDDGPQGIESMPWQWLANEVRIPYLKQDVNVMVEGTIVATKPSIAFVGAMNAFVIGMLPLAVAYLLQAAWRKRDDFSLLMIALLGATYLPPFFAAVLVHRISYIFYFLPVLPALCAGIAYCLLDARMPRILPIVYAAGVILGFLALFPFRTMM